MKYLKLLIGHLISFVFIYLLVDKLDIDKIEDFTHQIHWEYFCLAIFINVISYFVHALRFNRFYKDQHFSFSNLVKTILIGHMFNTILPSKAGELIRPLYFHRMTQIKYIDILSTCFIERVFDGLLVLFLLFTSILYFGTNDLVVAGTYFTLFLYVGCLIFCIACVIFKDKILTLLSKSSHKFTALIQGAFKDFLSGLARIQGISNLNWIIFYTFMYWFLNIMALWAILYTIDLPAQIQNPITAMFIAGSMGVALSLPSAPANVGVYHYAIYMIFTIIVERSNLLVDSNLFIIAAVLIHLGAIIPDLFLGAVSYYTFPKTKKDNPQV